MLNLLSLQTKGLFAIGVFAFFGIFALSNFNNNDSLPQTIFAAGDTRGYDFNQPTTTIQLPGILQEVSGLTDIDNNTLACVQDEDGIVFIYDWPKEKIIREIHFGGAGDYEGIARVKNTLYVLRSDGWLFEIENFAGEDFKVKKYNTDIPIKNNEGLAYDAARHRLLIAGKSEPEGDEYEDTRAIFTFDLKTMQLKKQPVCIFHKSAIEQFVRKNECGLSKEKIDAGLKFYPSAIAVHPLTAQLFVLSSKGKLVFIFNHNYELEAVHHLDKKIHRQPEGIAFLANGDMFISNEGKKDEPLLLRFLYKKK